MVGRMTPLLLITVMVVASLACNLPFLRRAAPVLTPEGDEIPPAEEARDSDVDDLESAATEGDQPEGDPTEPGPRSPSPSPRPDVEGQNATVSVTATRTPTASSTPTPRPTVPTATPKPSNTPKPTAVPSDTPLPTSVPSNTPTATPEPTDTPELSPPASPTDLRRTKWICNSEEYSLTLEWKDRADNEEGFRIYLDGKAIDAVKANVTSFSYKPPDYRFHTYAVEAYNRAGTSKQSTYDDEGCLY